MSAPLLATKLYLPPLRPGFVPRPRLIERLNEGFAQGCKLTLISAPAGFGKTTLVSEWIASLTPNPSPNERGEGVIATWLSLDEGDNDPARFIAYLVKALQTIRAGIGEGLLAALQSTQPLQIEVILTSLLNEISTTPDPFLLVLDDYHALDSHSVDQALTFIIEHQPPQMHLVIATREDPSLPLARLRACGQMTELRAADLRFTPAEAAEFLNRMMGLALSEEDIAALEARTEGWIAGLQMAAISIQGHQDTAGFIQSFTGSHRFVMDYLLEEILHRQPKNIQVFLLRTSILEQMCGPLCDAILIDSSLPGQTTLEQLDHANLFVVPQDDERLWYRYHHLFGDLLCKRLGQNLTSDEIAKIQIRASEWYEKNGMILEAFRHATEANDLERAIRLMDSKKMPVHQRGAATTILSWLETLPKALLDARPALWWKQVSMLLLIGQPKGIDEKLQALEAALACTTPQGANPDDTTRDLIGRAAAARANLAQLNYQAETILVHGQRALEYLHPDNLADRSMAVRSMGFAYYSQNDLASAGRAYAEALSLARAAGDPVDATMASIRLSQLEEEKGQLHQSFETLQQILKMVDVYSPYNAPLVFAGLARIYYEWNDLNTAGQYAEKTLQLARQYDQVIDRVIAGELFMAHLKLARGDTAGFAQYLAQAEQTIREKNYPLRLPSVAFSRVFFHLRQGNLEAAAQLVHQYDLPLMQARLLTAQKDPSAALVILEPLHQEAEAKGLLDRLLRVTAVQSMALFALGDQDKAVERLDQALVQAEPEGFIRLFLDEGDLMEELLNAMATRGMRPGYVQKLLKAFDAEPKEHQPMASEPGSSSLVEPLSPRELEVLRLIAQGLSNQEICAKLFLALDTVKGHNRRIFEKLQVKRRTEAIARARELGLI